MSTEGEEQAQGLRPLEEGLESSETPETGKTWASRVLANSLLVVCLLLSIAYACDIFVTSVYLTWGRHLLSTLQERDLLDLYSLVLFGLGTMYLGLIGIGLSGMRLFSKYEESRQQQALCLVYLVWGALGLIGATRIYRDITSVMRESGPWFHLQLGRPLTEGYPYLAQVIFLDGFFVVGILVGILVLFRSQENDEAFSWTLSALILGAALWFLILSWTTSLLGVLILLLVLFLAFISRLRKALHCLSQAWTSSEQELLEEGEQEVPSL